jgi:hypothetical protein
VDDNDKFFGVSVVGLTDWALHDCIVLLALASLEVSSDVETRYTQNSVFKLLIVDDSALIDSFFHLEGIHICDNLLLSTSDGIVMLINTQVLKYFLFRRQNRFDSVLAYSFLYNFESCDLIECSKHC